MTTSVLCALLLSAAIASAAAALVLRRNAGHGLRPGETVVIHTNGDEPRSIRGVVVQDCEPRTGAGGTILAAAKLLQREGDLELEGQTWVPRHQQSFIQLIPPGKDG